MEHSKEFMKEMIIFCREQGVASFEMDDTGVLKVSFDPRAFIGEKQVALTPDVTKTALKDLLVDMEREKLEEEEKYLFP